MTTNIEAVISARFDQLLGKERIEQEIEESAKKVSGIGARAAQSVANDIIGSVPEGQTGTDELRSFDKIQRAFEASGKLIDEKSKELLQEFDYKRSLGMTESQWKSFEKRFTELGSGSSTEMKDLEQFIRKEYSGVKEGEVREYFDAIAGAAGKTDFTKDYQDYIRKAHAYEKLYKLGDEGEDLLTGYERRRTRGMTERQEEGYSDKFSAYKERIEDFRTKVLPKFELPETDEAKLEQSLKQLTENTTKSYNQIKSSIQDTIDTQDNFFKQLQQAGYIAMVGGIFNQAGKIAVGSAAIDARERTAFDMTSAVGMYTERQQYDLFKENTERSLMATTIGMLIGGGAGFMAGGPIGAAVGGSMGSGIGSQISEYFNKQAEGETGERIKLLQQAYQMGMGRVEEFRPYEIEATKASGRFGVDLRGSSGVGYTLQQELQFKEGFGSARGRFDEGLYGEQLAFSRANYLNPDELMKLNSYSRLTGQEYNTRMLTGGKEVAEGTFGPSMNKERIVEVLESIAEINKEMLKHSASADSRDALRLAGIAEGLFGVTNPYGRLGDLGMNTVRGMEGLGQPSSEAHEAFLFRAYSKANGGKFFGEQGFLAREEGGVYYKDNLKLILQQLEQESGGSEEMSQAMIYGMNLKGATPEMKLRLSKLAAGGTIDIDGYKDGKLEKTQVTGIEGYLDYMNKYGERLKAGGKTDTEIEEEKKRIEKAAFGAATIYETTAEKIARIHEETANLWKEKTQKMILELEEHQKTWLTSEKTIESAFIKLAEALKYFDRKIAETTGNAPRSSISPFSGSPEPSDAEIEAAMRKQQNASVGAYEKHINSASKEYNVESALIKAIIKNESGGDASAVSRKGAKGLMQLMDPTARDLGVTDSLDPQQNIFGGTKYISQLMEKYHGNMGSTIAAYNAGPGNVDKYKGIPPFAETEKYVKDVTSDYNKYHDAELYKKMNTVAEKLLQFSDGFNPTINIGFHGFGNKTQSEYENSIITSNSKK